MTDADEYAEMQRNFAAQVAHTESAMGRGPQAPVGMTARQQVWWEAWKSAFSSIRNDFLDGRHHTIDAQDWYYHTADRALAEFDKRFGGAS